MGQVGNLPCQAISLRHHSKRDCDSAHDYDLMQQTADFRARRFGNDLAGEWSDEVADFEAQPEAPGGLRFEPYGYGSEPLGLVCVGQQGQSLKRLGDGRRAGSPIHLDTGATGDEWADLVSTGAK